MIPPGAVRPAVTRTMLALVAVYERDGRATVRTVVAELGYGVSSVSRAHTHLLELRERGLVGWEGPGTLRPLVAPVLARNETVT